MSAERKTSRCTRLVYRLYLFTFYFKKQENILFLPEIINIQYFFMNKMHNLQSGIWVLLCVRVNASHSTLFIQLVSFHRVITVWSILIIKVSLIFLHNITVFIGKRLRLFKFTILHCAVCLLFYLNTFRRFGLDPTAVQHSPRFASYAAQSSFHTLWDLASF